MSKEVQCAQFVYCRESIVHKAVILRTSDNEEGFFSFGATIARRLMSVPRVGG